MVISSAPKRNCYGIGYQLGGQRKNGWIGSQKGNKMVRSYSSVPFLSWTFRLGGYINASLFGEEKDVVAPFHTFTINVIIGNKEEVESAYPTVYPCSPDFELDNWSIVEIPVAHKLIK